MNLKFTPVFILATIAVASLFPIALGLTVEGIGGAVAAVVVASLFVESSSRPAFGGRAFGQAGIVGDLALIEREYREVQVSLNAVQEDLNGHSKAIKSGMDELQNRMLHLEQHVVSLDGLPSSRFGFSGPSFGALAVQGVSDNSSFSALKEWNFGTCRLSVNSSIRAALTNDGAGTSNDGSIPSNPERGGFVLPAQRALRLLDVLPSRPTTSDSVEFVQITATGDAAEQELEGDEKAEIDMEGALEKAPIVTIAGHTTASRQVLGDQAGLQAAIDRVIRNKVLSRLEYQIINGTGGQGFIDGFVNQGTTFIPTVASTPADIVGESMVAQANAGFMPGLVLLNPLDWFAMTITKDTEGDYIFGSPTVPVPPALWNAPIVATPSVPQGQGLTIDTSYTTVLDRESANVMLSNSHKDYFTRNLIAILGELRAGLEILDTRAVYKFDLVQS